MRGLLLRGMVGGDRGACDGSVVVVVDVLMGWFVGGSGWVVARVVLSLAWARFGFGLKLEAGLSKYG